MGALDILSDNAGESKKSCGVAVNITEPRDAAGAKGFAGRAAVITLGCAKNQVDSEVMVGVLRNTGFEIVNELDMADVAVINTCGFLESAVKESVDCVLEVSRLKRQGSLRRLIVAGCMVERYKGDIRKALPEVDAFISVDDLLKVGEAATGEEADVKNLLTEAGRPYFIYNESMPRHLSTRQHFAYVKIAEGCDRPCAFCIIPKIKGAMRSRAIDSVVREVAALGEQGVREINLVAQDLTAYGSESGPGGLSKLLRALNEAGSVDWIRLLYAYPIGLDDELIDTIVSSPRVCNYIDVPLQHSSEAVLRAMKRPIGRFASRRMVEALRNRAPQIHIRTTFIVGFPGETEEDIQDLEKFILEGHFTNVGVFTYSPEEGTKAFDFSGQIDEKEKKSRRDRVMKAQQIALTKRLQGFVGTDVDVLIDGTHEDSDLILSARAYFQAPEVDGQVIINDVEGLTLASVSTGHLGRAKITEVAGYDLVGTLIR